MSQSGYTPIKLYASTTAAATPVAANLDNTNGAELAINITDGKLFYKDNSNVVQVIATKAGASGDVVGPASATANAVPSFNSTTGKLIQNNSGVTIASNVVSATGFAGALNGTVGATTASTGAFTTLSASSTTTLTALTASTALALDASKSVVSITNTGSGNNVLATSPTITGLTFTSAASAAPAFSASMSTTQTLSNGTYTLLNFDTKTGGINFDTNSNFNTTTYLFTPTVAGYYQVNSSVFFNTGGGQVYLLLYKNASIFASIYFPNNVSAGAIAAVSGLIYCNGSTDTISVYAFQSSGVSMSGVGGTAASFSAAMIRSA